MARATVLKTGGISVDTTDFRSFAKDLRRASPAMTRSMRANLRAAGKVVANEAVRLADSDKVAATVRTNVSGASVAILIGRPGQPLAGLRELGNKGSNGAVSFDHPVYGHDVWVEQPTHPCLAPAMAAKGDEAAEMAFSALDDAVRIAAGGI